MIISHATVGARAGCVHGAGQSQEARCYGFTTCPPNKTSSPG